MLPKGSVSLIFVYNDITKCFSTRCLDRGPMERKGMLREGMNRRDRCHRRDYKDVVRFRR